jgi:peptidoglycan/LPS O-acetylase OafA/YrhL
MKTEIAKTPSDHMPWLDWLRFIAAFVVVIAHARADTFPAFGELPEAQKTMATQLFYAVTRLGHEAVIVFFVLSGFLVGGKVIERSVDGSFDPLSYAVDRFSRLYVPLLPALFLTVIAGIVAGIPISVYEFIGNLASLQGVAVQPPRANGPLWSLSYEVWFYVLACVASVAIKRRSTTSFLVLIVVLLLFTALEPHYLFCWIIGAFAYITRPRWSGVWLGLGVVVTAVGISFSQIASESRSIIGLASFISRELAVMVLATGVAVTVQQLITFRRGGWIAAFDRQGGLLAKGSYTLYLTHYPILVAITGLGWMPYAEVSAVSVISFFAKITVCLLGAWAMYLMFERHTRTLRNWLKRQKTRSRNLEELL